MSAIPKSGRQAIAGFVTITGVVAIWAVSAYRQEGSTEEIARVWVGGQWDVARTCMVGTPVRSDDVAGIHTKLEGRLLDALLEVGEAPERMDEGAIWPRRCVPLLSSLRVGPGATNGNPDAALSTLAVLLPRVIETRDDESERARIGDRAALLEIAQQVALLDHIMPSGEEYPVEEYRSADAPHAHAVLESLDCPRARPARRAFANSLLRTEPEVMDFRAEGDRVRRVQRTAEGDGFVLITDAPGVPSVETPFAMTGFRALRFVDLERVLLLRDTDLALHDLAGGEPLAIEAGGVAGADRLAVCRAADRVFFVTASRAEATAGFLDLAEVPPHATVLGAVLADAGSVVACDEEGFAILEPTERGRGSMCDLHACTDTPRLGRTHDVEIAIVHGELLAITRARHTSIPVATWLARRTVPTWTDAVVVPRGSVQTGSAPGIRSCHDADVPLVLP